MFSSFLNRSKRNSSWKDLCLEWRIGFWLSMDLNPTWIGSVWAGPDMHLKAGPGVGSIYIIYNPFHAQFKMMSASNMHTSHKRFYFILFLFSLKSFWFFAQSWRSTDTWEIERHGSCFLNAQSKALLKVLNFFPRVY